LLNLAPAAAATAPQVPAVPLRSQLSQSLQQARLPAAAKAQCYRAWLDWSSRLLLAVVMRGRLLLGRLRDIATSAAAAAALALTRSSSQSWVQLMAIPSRLLMLQVAVGCGQQPALQQQQSHAAALLQPWRAKCSRLLQLIAGMWQCSAAMLVVRMQL
jgi:hypothetical protein